MSELEKMVVSDEAIENLVEKVNGHLNKVNIDKDEIVARLEAAKKDAQKSIDNIINAVTMGFASADLKTKLDSLNDKKAELEVKIEHTKVQGENSMVVGSDIRKALKSLRHYLLTRDLVEIKKFMKIFVKSIVVGKEEIEVTFNLLASFIGDLVEYDMVRSIYRNELYTPNVKEKKMKLPNKLELIHDKRKRII